MSTTYYSCAFPTAASSLTADIHSMDDVNHLLDQVAEGDLLMSFSRNGWLLDALYKACSSLKLEHLRDLAKVYSFFSPRTIPIALCEIDSILAFAKESPQGFAQSMNEPYDAEYIFSSLRNAVERTDVLQPNRAEDGDHLEYLFGWLIALRSLLAKAQESGLCLVHVQPMDQSYDRSGT